MKKVLVLLAAICLITMAASSKKSFSINTESKAIEVMNEKYKACIAACNESIKSSKTCASMCSKDKNTKMSNCIQLCKENIAACKVAIKAMKSNSSDVKSACANCAIACDKCAAECEKFDHEHCKKCAADCRKAVKLCKEM